MKDAVTSILVMNRCTDLVCLPELQHKCMSTGHALQERVLQKGAKLNQPEMSQMFKPLTAYIEQGVEKVVDKTRDEMEGISEEHANDIALEKVCTSRRTRLSETVLLTINGERKRFSYWQVPQDLQIEDPEYSLDDITNSELLDAETDDESWDDVLPHAVVKGPVFFSVLAFCTSVGFSKYCSENKLSRNKSVKLLSDLKRNHLICETHYTSLMNILSLHSECTACGKINRPNKRRRLGSLPKKLR